MHDEEEQASNILGVTSEKPPAFTKSNSEDTSIQSFGEFNKDSVEEEVARGSDSAVHTVEKEQDNITFDGETGHVDGLEGGLLLLDHCLLCGCLIHPALSPCILQFPL